MNEKVNNQIQEIILDSNIIQYLNDPNIKIDLLNYLVGLRKFNYSYAISEVSTCELLSNANCDQEKEGIELLNIFKRYIVDTNVLVLSSQLSTIYHYEGIPNEKSISIADRIIAATAIATGSYILTADIQDFPRPFFREYEEKLFFYKQKNKTHMRVVQMLYPDIPVLNQKLSERP